VLKFYCGSADDEAGTKQIGELILSKMDYHGSGAAYRVPKGNVFWKSHAQSLKGKYFSGGREGCVSSFMINYKAWEPEEIYLQAGFDKATAEQVLRAVYGRDYVPKWEQTSLGSSSSSSAGTSSISASSSANMGIATDQPAAAAAATRTTSSAASQQPTAAPAGTNAGSTDNGTSNSQLDVTAAAQAASAAKAAADAAVAARAAADAAAATARAAAAAAAAAEAAAKAAAAAEAAAAPPAAKI
jgi:hypothetical protein